MYQRIGLLGINIELIVGHDALTTPRPPTAIPEAYGYGVGDTQTPRPHVAVARRFRSSILDPAQVDTP